MKRLNIIIALVFILNNCGVYAQEVKDSVPPLPSDELEVIKDFKARLATSKALTWEYIPVEWNPESLNYDYDVIIRNLELEYLPPLMRPLTLYPEPPKKTYNGSVLGAYGFPKAWKGHLVYGNSWKNRYEVGVRYFTNGYNHSKNDSLLQTENHDASLTLSSKLTSRVKIGTDINYLRETRKFQDDMGLIQTRVQQGIGAKIGFESPIDEDYDFNYFINAGYDRTSLSNVELFENILSLEGGIQYDWSNLRMTVKSHFKQINDDVLSTQNLIDNSLLLAYTRGRHFLAIGGSHFYTKDDGNRLLPTFNVAYNLFDTEHFVEIKGQNKIAINNYKQLLKWNPFLLSIGSQRELYYHQEFTLGVRGAIRNVNYRIEGGFSKLYNTPTAYLSTKDKINHTLSLNYIDGSAILLRTHITYNFNENTHIDMAASWADLDAEDSDDFYSEWYNTSLSLSSSFKLMDNNLNLKPGFLLLYGMKETSESDSRLVHDLYLDVYYQLSDHFSLYLNASNLLNNQNERWVNRPQLERRVLIGVKAKF